MHRAATVILGLMVATTASAQCYVRQAMTAKQQAKIVRVTDVQTLTVPVSATHHKCIVTFRAQVDDQWVNGEGEKIMPTTVSEKELCAAALDTGRVQILSRAETRDISVETSMVCDERPEIQVRNVRPGETVRDSEVRVHPNFPRPFRYLGTQCRWFIEPTVRNQDFGQYQGIICQTNGSQWRVVDKW